MPRPGRAGKQRRHTFSWADGEPGELAGHRLAPGAGPAMSVPAEDRIAGLLRRSLSALALTALRVSHHAVVLRPGWRCVSRPAAPLPADGPP